MILNIIIIIILSIAAYMGCRRGFLHESIYAIGYGLSFLTAVHWFKPLGKVLQLWIPYPMPSIDQKMAFYKGDGIYSLDQAFNAAIAFLIILCIGWLLTRFIGVMCYRLQQTFRKMPVWRLVNRMLGGITSVVISEITLVLIMLLLSFIPNTFIQHLLQYSSLAQLIALDTPVISHYIQQLWLALI